MWKRKGKEKILFDIVGSYIFWISIYNILGWHNRKPCVQIDFCVFQCLVA